MPNTDQTELAKFHKLCELSIIVEEDGSNPVLCVTANVRDSTTGEYHEFKRSVALTPLMRALADKIRQYHDSLHMQVSGRLPNANLDWSDPDFDNYQDWVDGEKHWRGLGLSTDSPRDDSFYDAPEFVDDGGLPPGVDPLQVQGWYDSIRNTARHLGEAKAVKSLYSELKTYGNKAQSYANRGRSWAASHKGEIGMAASFVPGGNAALQTGFKVYDAVQAARKKNPEALAALKKIKALAESGDSKAVEAFAAAQKMNDMLNAKIAQYKTRVSGDMEVSGWLYNRPYRTNAQVLGDAVTGKFPTVSMALREGWQDGLKFAGVMQRRNIKLLW